MFLTGAHGLPFCVCQSSASAATNASRTRFPAVARLFRTLDYHKGERARGAADCGESGATLRANGLDVLETVCDISARLVVNRVSLKTKGNDVKRLIAALKAQLDAAEDK